MYADFVLNTYIELAVNACKYGHDQLANKMFKAVIEESQRAYYDVPFQVDVLTNIASVYLDRKQYRRAESTYKKALALWNVLPSQYAAHSSETLDRLAELATLQGKYGQSEQYYKRALAAERKAISPNRQRLAQRLRRLACVLFKRQKLDAAHAALMEANALSNAT